jgi:hypothetical protein
MPLMRQTTYIVVAGADTREGRRDYCRPVPSVRIRLRGARKGSLRIASTRHDSPRNVKALERPRRPDGAIRSDCPARGRGRGPPLITTLWYVPRGPDCAHHGALPGPACLVKPPIRRPMRRAHWGLARYDAGNADKLGTYFCRLNLVQSLS